MQIPFGRIEIGVSHHELYNVYIYPLLDQACAERVPKVMKTKFHPQRLLYARAGLIEQPK